MDTPTPATLALACALCAAAALVAAPAHPAHACGLESDTACDDTGQGSADEARWMLGRVVAAVKADQPRALDAFSRGADGFRTQDRYVFCINAATSRVSAHPDPKLRGQDVRALRDPDGKAFAAAMLDAAEEGRVAEVGYLYPRPGSAVPTRKVSFVTRVRHQVCGVGAYDVSVAATGAAGDEGHQPAAASAAQVAPETATRLARLRQRLDRGMPVGLRADWAAFLQALDEQRGAEQAVLTRAREDVRVVGAALGGGGGAIPPATSGSLHDLGGETSR